MALLTGSASHRSRMSLGMLRWPLGDRLHIFRVGALGLVMPLKSASATNLGRTCPICPLEFFQSWRETKLEMVINILMDKLRKFYGAFFNHCPQQVCLWPGQMHMSQLMDYLTHCTSQCALRCEGQTSFPPPPEYWMYGRFKKIRNPRAKSNKFETKKSGSTNLGQETLSNVPSYIDLWWMTKQDLFKLETLDMQASRIALRVAGDATHWAVSSLSLQAWNEQKSKTHQWSKLGKNMITSLSQVCFSKNEHSKP